jgi:hypothetical protein
MVTIQVDEKTAKAIEMAATVRGLSVSEYVSSLVMMKNTLPPKDAWDSIEKQFLELSVDGGLPGAFSRDDIYSDHD